LLRVLAEIRRFGGIRHAVAAGSKDSDLGF
jgi:hypothetical protein